MHNKTSLNSLPIVTLLQFALIVCLVCLQNPITSVSLLLKKMFVGSRRAVENKSHIRKLWTSVTAENTLNAFAFIESDRHFTIPKIASGIEIKFTSADIVMSDKIAITFGFRKI